MIEEKNRRYDLSFPRLPPSLSGPTKNENNERHWRRLPRRRRPPSLLLGVHQWCCQLTAARRLFQTQQRSLGSRRRVNMKHSTHHIT